MKIINKLKLVDYLSAPIYGFIILIILHLLCKYDLPFLMNDEIIFDLVLIGLLVFGNNLITRTNIKTSVYQEVDNLKTMNFLFYNLIVSRCLVYRVKKFNAVSFLFVANYLNGFQPEILEGCASLVFNNVTLSSKSILSSKLSASIYLKNFILKNLLKLSLNNKLFNLV